MGSSSKKAQQRKRKMVGKTKDSLRTSVNLYLVLILLVLPLYMKGGYTMIGDAKYFFFRNVTLIFMFLTTVMLGVLITLQDRKKESEKSSLSSTDIMALLYGGFAIVSWCLSAHKDTAWWGASDWYMGLLSQLMFVWIYFIVSRWCNDTKGVLQIMFVGAIAVMGLGILNRYVFDPLSMYKGLDDWNREHLLSTIGNQNWYCGYVSVASAVCVCFTCIGKKGLRLAGLIGSLFLFWTILTQGSEGGYLILIAETAVVFLWSLKERQRLMRFLSVMACFPLAALIGQYCIRFRGLVLVEDGLLSGFLFWKGWTTALIIIIASYILLWVREKRFCTDKLASGKIRKIVLCISGVIFILGIIVLIACQIWDGVWNLFGQNAMLRITDEWGNSRGALWRMSIGCFTQGNVIEKLVGAGSDCFRYVMYERYAVNDIMHATGQWGEAIFANAHNEWLNMLINQGILGLVFYAGVFVTLLVRLWKNSDKNLFALVGMLAIAGYCLYGFVSFQQTVSTPLMFAVLGLSEGILRKKTNIRQASEH